MLRFAVKNLFQAKVKLAISIGGIAFALLLILVLGAIFAGLNHQATAYIRESRASVWVMQKGVANMHMANTILPSSIEKKILDTRGVSSVSAILYVSGFLKIKGVKSLSYVVGYDPGEDAGGPWAMARGKSKPAHDEIIIDEELAAKRRVGVGDKISVLGRKMRIVGLSRETFSMANTVTFVNRNDMEIMMRAPDQRSYFLVMTKPGQGAAAVAKRIESRVAGANVMTTTAFLSSEAKLIRQMGIDIINAMSIIGFIIGIMIVGLTIYTSTLEKSRDFAILKAVGAARSRLYAAVFAQALISVALGGALGWLLALATRAIIERLVPEMPLVFAAADVGRVAVAMVGVAILSSYLPIRRVAGVDPMSVFKS